MAKEKTQEIQQAWEWDPRGPRYSLSPELAIKMPVDDGHFVFRVWFFFHGRKISGIDPDKLEDEEQGHHQHAGVDPRQRPVPAFITQ